MNSCDRVLGFLVLCSACFGVGGCSTVRTGEPVPATSSESARLPAPTSSPANSDDFGSLQACDLLGKSLEGQGFNPVQKNRDAEPNGCTSGKSQFAFIILNLQENAVFDQLDVGSEEVRAGDVNGRPAVQARNGLGASGGCDISMKVGARSRAVLVSTMVTGSTDEACEFVNSVAEKVEPLLPKIN